MKKLFRKHVPIAIQERETLFVREDNVDDEVQLDPYQNQPFEPEEVIKAPPKLDVTLEITEFKSDEMPFPRWGHCMLVMERRLFVFGGVVYRPSTATLQQYAALFGHGNYSEPCFVYEADFMHDAVAKTDGTNPELLLPHSNFPSFHPRLRWHPRLPTVDPRGGELSPILRVGVAAVTWGHKILCFGGASLAGNVSAVVRQHHNDLWQLDTSNWMWARLRIGGEPPTPRAFSLMCEFDNMLYFYGGGNTQSSVYDICSPIRLHRIDLHTIREWIPMPDKGEPPLMGGFGMVVHNKRLFIYGAFFTRRTRRQVAIYDLSTSTWWHRPIPHNPLFALTVQVDKRWWVILGTDKFGVMDLETGSWYPSEVSEKQRSVIRDGKQIAAMEDELGGVRWILVSGQVDREEGRAEFEVHRFTLTLYGKEGQTLTPTILPMTADEERRHMDSYFNAEAADVEATRMWAAQYREMKKNGDMKLRLQKELQKFWEKKYTRSNMACEALEERAQRLRAELRERLKDRELLSARRM